MAVLGRNSESVEEFRETLEPSYSKNNMQKNVIFKV